MDDEKAAVFTVKLLDSLELIVTTAFLSDSVELSINDAFVVGINRDGGSIRNDGFHTVASRRETKHARTIRIGANFTQRCFRKTEFKAVVILALNASVAAGKLNIL